MPLSAAEQKPSDFAADHLGIYSNEQAFCPGQNLATVVCKLGFAMVLFVRGSGVPASKHQLDAERNWLEILDLHVPRHRQHAKLAICLTHGLVQQGGNDAAVRVSWRTFEPPCQLYPADNRVLLIDEEFEPQAGAVGLPATETAVQSAVGQGS